MNSRIEKLAKAALTGDIYPQHVRYEPAEIRSDADAGKAIAHYLSLQPMELREEEYLADRYRLDGLRGVPGCFYRPGYSPRIRYRSSLCSSSPTDLFYWGWTHVAVDFAYLLNNGFRGYYQRIAAAKEKYAADPQKTDFLTGMTYCLDSLAERYRRYAVMAAEEAAALPEGQRKASLLRLADTLTRIPMEPARSFFDAVQFTWIAFCIAPDSLGRIDQYLYPFYCREMEAGILTDETAMELLQELFIKVHGAQADNVAMDISGHNHLVVGGYLKNGEDGFNALSRLVLEAIADLPTYRPQASVRCTARTTPETMEYITEMNHRSQLIVFVNDEPRIRGMVNCGISWEDAVDYTVIGCNEWALAGKSKLDLAHINLVHSLQQTLYCSGGADSFAEFYQKFEAELRADFRTVIDEYGNYARASAQERNIWSSIFHDDCIENARPMTDMGTRYYGLTMSFNSISNVADSLSVIRQFVYDEKRLTYSQLLQALEANWEGYEALRTQILKEGHFFGNDDDYADSIAQDVANSIYAIKEEMTSPYIKNLVVGSFVGATHPNIILGKRTKATPDGRYCGEEFTMGISQSQGKDKNGITALLKSIAKLDYSKLCGCIVSNLKMDKNMADTPEKRKKLASAYRAFLKLGGMQLQINYISTEELLCAQRNPDQYRNLMVRVTGYSGFFTRFDEDLQNDIIKRTAQC